MSGAAALSWPGVTQAQLRNELPNEGRAVRGPGVPLPIAVVPTRAGRVQGLI